MDGEGHRRRSAMLLVTPERAGREELASSFMRTCIPLRLGGLGAPTAVEAGRGDVSHRENSRAEAHGPACLPQPCDGDTSGWIKPMMSSCEQAQASAARQARVRPTLHARCLSDTCIAVIMPRKIAPPFASALSCDLRRFRRAWVQNVCQVARTSSAVVLQGALGSRRTTRVGHLDFCGGLQRTTYTIAVQQASLISVAGFSKQ